MQLVSPGPARQETVCKVDRHLHCAAQHVAAPPRTKEVQLLSQAQHVRRQPVRSTGNCTAQHSMYLTFRRVAAVCSWCCDRVHQVAVHQTDPPCGGTLMCKQEAKATFLRVAQTCPPESTC